MSKTKHKYSAHIEEKENYNLSNLLPSQPSKIKGWKRRRQGSMGQIDSISTFFTPVIRTLNFDESTCSIHQKIAKRVEEAQSISRTRQRRQEDGLERSFKKSRNEEDLRVIINSKDKQINSLHSHIKVLENTIHLLKSEVVTTKRSQKAEIEEQQKQEKINYKKQYELLQKQNKKIKAELHEYQSITPKLNQLQTIQNKLINQNKKLKSFREEIGYTLEQLESMMGHSSRSEINRKISEVIHSVIN